MTAPIADTECDDPFARAYEIIDSLQEEQDAIEQIQREIEHINNWLYQDNAAALYGTDPHFDDYMDLKQTQECARY